MFTLPHNTIAYLYKEAIDMRLGMFRIFPLCHYAKNLQHCKINELPDVELAQI